MSPSALLFRTLPIAILFAICGARGGAESLPESPSPALWSVLPLRDNAPPVPKSGVRSSHPLDAFIDAALARREFSPAPPADRRSLIRRASYDLTGLPPRPAQVEAFAADPRPDQEVFAALVEELLASPHYGEHWGRHWLDVVRYADTAGENSDHPLPHAWRYRNWVLDAFNRDLPYDQFAKSQLAGDLLPETAPAEDRREGIVATGYLAIARRFGHDIDQSMYLTHEDVIDNLGKTFLGLSISCARCHDHKHDPITQRDYYALYSVFDSTRFSFPGCEPAQQPRDLVSLPAEDFAARHKDWEKELAALKAKSGIDEHPARALRLKELAAHASTLVSTGDVPDAGAVQVSATPLRLDVKPGEAIQLSILPRGDYGADTTVLEFTITHGEGPSAVCWSPSDLIDDLLLGNPHPARNGAAWCFLDTTGGDPEFLAGRKESVQDRAELKAWENGAPPSVLVNTSSEAVPVWTALPPRTFFCHPGPKGPVAIAWLSPIEGLVTIGLTVRDGHPGGDGVAWRLEHLADPGLAEAFQALGEVSVLNPELEATLAAHRAAEPQPALAYAVAEGDPTPARVQERADPELPGDEIPRQFLSILGGGPLGDEHSSGRLDLAQRIANPGNPLFARIMVNRIWTWHFGRGLVATPNDFGHHGSPPSHPELLDFLARTFIESDWSVKAMHRLIMTSATYQRAVRAGLPPESFAAFAPRRLSAEELRDTLLLAAGRLDLTPGEEHPFPPVAQWSFTQHAPFADDYPTGKRSVYAMRKRNRTSPYFALFNGADPNASTPEREVTTTPGQALYFVNDPFFHDCAAQFATRIREAAPDPAGRLDFACRELFARPATTEEVTSFTEFASTLAATLDGEPKAMEIEIWNSYARILLGSNELLQLD